MKVGVHLNARPELTGQILPPCCRNDFRNRKILSLRIFPMEQRRRDPDFVRYFYARGTSSVFHGIHLDREFTKFTLEIMKCFVKVLDLTPTRLTARPRRLFARDDDQGG
jgi:hypothetical protein